MPKERQILITKEGNIRRIEILLSYNGLDHDPPVVPWERSREKFQRFILLEVVAHLAPRLPIAISHPGLGDIERRLKSIQWQIMIIYESRGNQLSQAPFLLLIVDWPFGYIDREMLFTWEQILGGALLSALEMVLAISDASSSTLVSALDVII